MLHLQARPLVISMCCRRGYSLISLNVLLIIIVVLHLCSSHARPLIHFPSFAVKQETIAYRTMVPVCVFLARSALKIHTLHQFLHATWKKSRSRNQLSTWYFQSRLRAGTPELSQCVPFGKSTQSLREKRMTKQAHWLLILNDTPLEVSLV